MTSIGRYCKSIWRTVLTAASFAICSGVVAEPSRQAFATPEEAGKALISAVKAGDERAVIGMLGASSKEWISSGDRVADQAAEARFVAAYERQNGIERPSPEMAIIVTGDDEFPFPIPIVRSSDGRWSFNPVLGREEILNRRIGRNELLTIRTLLAIGDAQVEYALRASEGAGNTVYAQRFVSTKGKRDGLFWPTSGGEPASPLGALVASAAKEGYQSKDRPTGAPSEPFNGYRYRMLFAQGSKAMGGAYSYLVGNRMIGGFAVIAWPAKYGISGIKTFMMNHEQEVYEADLGSETERRTAAIRSYNPNKEWSKVDSK